MGEVVQLDHGEGLQMKLRIFAPQRRQQVREITEREFCVKSAGNVQLSCAFVYSLTRDAQRILNAVRVGIGLTRGAVKAAKLAVHIADVRGIEMTIDVEIGGAPVTAPAHRISQLAQGIQIIGTVKRYAIFESQPLAGLDSGLNIVQLLVVR